MRKRNSRVMIFKYSVLFYMAAAAWCLLGTGGGFHAALSFFQDKEIGMEPGSSTSMGFRYEEKFQNTLNHYRLFGSLYQPEYSTPVPGLESTDILGESCSQMVPQGICIAGDYMLVTAYDSGSSYKGEAGQSGWRANPSVLYVLSNQNPRNRELLTTIVLPDVNHVGGVAFDGENIWVAKSTDRQCSIISYDAIQDAVNSGKSSYRLSEYSQNVYCGAVASFVTWHGNRLWVGTYSNRINGKGMLRSYDVKKRQGKTGEIFTLERQDEVVIPEFANGAAFMEMGEKTYLAVTTSKGRYFDSKIYFYEVVEDCFTRRSLYHQYASWRFPPMAEELVCDGENTYFLFESSATCYSAPAYQGCSYPVDRICAVLTSELFQQTIFQDGQGGFYPRMLHCLPVCIQNRIDGLACWYPGILHYLLVCIPGRTGGWVCWDTEALYYLSVCITCQSNICPSRREKRPVAHSVAMRLSKAAHYGNKYVVNGRKFMYSIK